MRLLHTKTLQIVALDMKDEEFVNATSSRKQIISHCHSEILKYLATRGEKAHPKMFINNDRRLGQYVRIVKQYADIVGNTMNLEHYKKYPEVYNGIFSFHEDGVSGARTIHGTEFWFNDKYSLSPFDSHYLFSDAVSLYFKGVNIFPYIYGTQWRKYVPIENLKEIYRVVGKTLDKKVK